MPVPVNLSASDITATSVRLNWMRWTPLQLFLAGVLGVWLDPSDLSTLFQDAAGTIPVTSDGDPVGLMLDKSGNGNHALQQVSGSRLIYRTDGTLHWLEYNGVNSFLSFPNHPFTFTGGVTLFSGFSKTGSVNTFETLFSAGAVNDRGLNKSKSMGFLVGNDSRLGATPPYLATDIFKPSGVSGSTTIASGESRVASWSMENWSTHRDVGNTKIQLDGINETVSSYAITNPISLNSGPAYIGVFDPVVLASSFFKGKIFGMIARSSASTDSEITLATQYLAAKSGVTL